MISKNLQILGLQPRISRSLEQFFLTVGQNDFGNKIPLHSPTFAMHNRKNTGKPDLQTDLQNRAYEFFQDDQTAIQAVCRNRTVGRSENPGDE